jgi:amino acid permease
MRTTLFAPPFFSAAGMIAGLTIGAGIFAVPYAVTISGVGWSTLLAVLAAAAVLAIHLSYGEVVASTIEQHRLPGYVRRYLGSVPGWIAAVNEVIFVSGVLLGYVLLGGIFLSKIFGGAATYWSITFFVVGALLLLGRARQISEINFMLALPLMTSFVGIGLAGIVRGDIAQLPAIGNDPLFAFAVFLFSLSGYVVIADAYQFFRGTVDDCRRLRLLIVAGVVLPLITTAIFVAGVLMASGGAVTTDALSGLVAVLGPSVVQFGAALGFVAVFKSYLSLGYDLKEIYEFDFKISPTASWFLAVALPVVPFLFGANNFVSLIAFLGGISIAIDGIFIVLMLQKIRNFSFSFFANEPYRRQCAGCAFCF